jgi:adhesin transport system outer membrane protein
LGVTLDWKLPVNFMREHEIGAAQEAVIAAQYDKERLQLELDARVRGLWYELMAAEASLKIFEAYTLDAQQVVQGFKEQFRIGRRTLLDLLNAENELFTARSNATTTQQNIRVSAWRLLTLAGKLREELGL